MGERETIRDITMDILFFNTVLNMKKIKALQASKNSMESTIRNEDL